MSTGMVICSRCRRIVHQGLNKNVENGWYHCDDTTPRCEGATSDYPKRAADVRGEICEADGPLPAEGATTR